MNCILLIEDDAAVRAVIEEALSDYQVVANDGSSDIFKLIKEHKPDLVLLDYILPNINGGELCHQIKTNPDTSTIPVILISGFSRVLYSLGSYGSDAILEKPFDLDKLLETVAQFEQIREQEVTLLKKA